VILNTTRAVPDTNDEFYAHKKAAVRNGTAACVVLQINGVSAGVANPRVQPALGSSSLVLVYQAFVNHGVNLRHGGFVKRGCFFRISGFDRFEYVLDRRAHA